MDLDEDLVVDDVKLDLGQRTLMFFFGVWWSPGVVFGVWIVRYHEGPCGGAVVAAFDYAAGFE